MKLRSPVAIFALVLPLLAQDTRTIALTFDDLPQNGVYTTIAAARNMTERLLKALRQENVKAIGFVNEKQLFVGGQTEARIALLRMWLDAGMELGNHTYSHADFEAMPLWQYEDDVVRGDTVTRVLLSERNLVPRYFRHPYTRTGPTKEARDSLVQFLARRGYTVAPFTIEASDFLFNRLYVEANTKGDQELAASLRSAYLDYNDQMLAYYESLSEKLLNRSIPQISLMHACELNADVMPEMLRRFKRRGYRFVSLDEAMTDKAYSLPDGFVGKAGISWLHRWAVGMGKPNGYQNDPDPPKFLLDLLRAK